MVTKKVSHFGRLPSALGSHVSMLIDDKFLLVYGGTNGYRFFDSLMRYDIANKKWTLMMKYPECFKGSTFFTDGRIASASCQVNNEFAVFFGGCSAETDYAEFLVVPFEHVFNEDNFAEVSVVM